jgi:hypothetical protein
MNDSHARNIQFGLNRLIHSLALLGAIFRNVPALLVWWVLFLPFLFLGLMFTPRVFSILNLNDRWSWPNAYERVMLVQKRKLLTGTGAITAFFLYAPHYSLS